MENYKTLQSENESLRILVRQDPLTELFNRKTVEEEINHIVGRDTPGVFLMIDLDSFKLINDEYGHSMGDRILRKLAKLITYIFLKKDVVGRIGGDEFAVFMTGEYTGEAVLGKVESLQGRIRQAGSDFGLVRPLTITTGAAYAKKGDSFLQLYDRADCAMRHGKLDGKNHLCFYEASMERLIPAAAVPNGQAFSLSDMKYIIQELREISTPPQGAYCQDYHTFLSIYRLFERLLARFNLKCHIILISMTDSDGNYVNLEALTPQMDRLRQSICSALRASDIYTQYSSCQFLVMTPGAEAKDMNLIASRIQDAFQAKPARLADGRADGQTPGRADGQTPGWVNGSADVQLSYSFYPLEAIIPTPANGCIRDVMDRMHDGPVSPG